MPLPPRRPRSSLGAEHRSALGSSSKGSSTERRASEDEEEAKHRERVGKELKKLLRWTANESSAPRCRPTAPALAPRLRLPRTRCRPRRRARSPTPSLEVKREEKRREPSPVSTPFACFLIAAMASPRQATIFFFPSSVPESDSKPPFAPRSEHAGSKITSTGLRLSIDDARKWTEGARESARVCLCFFLPKKKRGAGKPRRKIGEAKKGKKKTHLDSLSLPLQMKNQQPEHEHTIVGYSLVKGIGDGESIWES